MFIYVLENKLWVYFPLFIYTIVPYTCVSRVMLIETHFHFTYLIYLFSNKLSFFKYSSTRNGKIVNILE